MTRVPSIDLANVDDDDGDDDDDDDNDDDDDDDDHNDDDNGWLCFFHLPGVPVDARTEADSEAVCESGPLSGKPKSLQRAAKRKTGLWKTRLRQDPKGWRKEPFFRYPSGSGPAGQSTSLNKF